MISHPLTYDEQARSSVRPGTNSGRIVPAIFMWAGDFVLLNAAFFLLFSLKRQGLNPSAPDGKLLAAFYGTWFLVTLSTGKFRLFERREWRWGIWRLIRSGLYLAYWTALVVVILGLYDSSRLLVLGTCLLFLVLQVTAFSAVHFLFSNGNGAGFPSAAGGIERPSRISWRLMAADFLAVGISFFVVNYLKRDGFQLLPDYEKLLLLLYGLWFFSSLVTGKFENRPYENPLQALWPWLKAGTLMGLGAALFLFTLRMLSFSRTQIFAPIALLLCMETFLVAIRYTRKHGAKYRDIQSSEKRNAILQQQQLPLETDLEALRNALMAPVRDSLETYCGKEDAAFFAFLDRNMDLSGILRAESAIRRSEDMVFLDTTGERAIRLFLNFHKVNDIRWLNRYFLEIYSMLVPGGYVVGRAHTIHTHRNWIFRKYPRHLAWGIYAVDFVIHRVAPKLPGLKHLYFYWTKGKNRRISRAEILGRLCFCGFKIVAETEIDERLCFVAQKELTPSRNRNPSYGPFVRLRRIGTGGRVLTIYKFRTMHPYSEFLQDYVYQTQGLQKGGKLNGDFRVTAWGKMMRKMWLDELPMLYNWLRGDLQFFGVRPLSAQYFGLYPPDLQELRSRVKPGLVPPFYAEDRLPRTVAEVCHSEWRYLDAYLRRPIRTQWGYFCRAAWNIVVKGARSA